MTDIFGFLGSSGCLRTSVRQNYVIKRTIKRQFGITLEIFRRRKSYLPTDNRYKIIMLESTLMQLTGTEIQGFTASIVALATAAAAIAGIIA
jgi:hypothetical protein